MREVYLFFFFAFSFGAFEFDAACTYSVSLLDWFIWAQEPSAPPDGQVRTAAAWVATCSSPRLPRCPPAYTMSAI